MDLERLGRNEAGIGERMFVFCYLCFVLFLESCEARYLISNQNVKICDYYPTAAVLDLVGMRCRVDRLIDYWKVLT